VNLTATELQAMKQRGEKIAALTSYDFFTTKLLDEAGIPLILVGDSLGMVVLGYENTRSVTMEDMLHHVRAVARAKPAGVVVADMPYRTYDTPQQAVANARRFVEAGADGVKLEGGTEMVPQIRAVVAAGIPVLGHVGLLPQSAAKYKVQGRTAASAEQLVRDAQAVEAAGVFALVVECVVANVARQVTAAVAVPTIGIGAGPDCDGQILVMHDLLGLGDRQPKHSRQYADLAAEMRRAFAAYKQDVQAGKFPGREHSFF
jgi:3-methyl-2-oxobutanoate hydroxymethyltransferase